MNHDNREPRSEAPGVPYRAQQHSGFERSRDVPSGAEASSSSEAHPELERGFAPSFDADELRNNPVLLAQVTAYLQENHLHLPLLTPDISEMARMKSETPELYEAYVRAIHSQIEADHVARTAPYFEPTKVARRGQLFGLIAVLSVLVFCGYLAFLGHSVSATIIAAIDLATLAAVFASGNRARKDE